jgi:hypothetical protein
MKTSDLGRSRRNGQFSRIEFHSAISSCRGGNPQPLPAIRPRFRTNCFRSGRHPGGWLWIPAVILIFVCMGVFSSSARGQLYSGSITGVATDQSGAAIPEARVTLTDAGKGYTYEVTTDNVGRYVLRSLPPSTYNLAIERTGFKTHVQDGITLAVDQNLTLDVVLQVGSALQSVKVTATPPVLSSQDAVTGQELNRTFINDLPLIQRSVFDLAYLSPGITQVSGGVTGGGIANNFISNGGRNATADILIDGVTTTNIEQESGIQIPLYTPSIDAVQEFKVQQSNFSADIGFSGATVVNMVTRSGTSEFHGSAYDFLRNNVLTANDWFNNASGLELAARRRNVFGATVGGPIRKGKTFFFFDYEGVRDRQAHTLRQGVPSALERTGDFGELCGYAGGTFDANGMCSSGDGQLWDPYSSVYDPSAGGPVRGQFIPFNNMATYQSPGNPNLVGTSLDLTTPGNAHAGNLIDPVAFKMTQFYPLPNLRVGQAGYDPYNNWISTATTPSNSDQWDIKVDHSFSENDRTSLKFSRSVSNSRLPNCFHNPGDACSNGPNTSSSHLFSLTHTHTFNPRTLLNATFGVARSYGLTGAGGLADYPGYDPVKELGLPEYLTRSGVPSTPSIYISDYAQAGNVNTLGTQPWGYYRNGNETFHLLTSLNRIQSRHDLKFGWEGRMHRMGMIIPGAPGGVFSYDRSSTSEFPSEGGGDALASFLTGIGGPGAWGQYQVPLAPSTQNFQYAAYVQDNWHATDRLTLNLGLRYDLNLSRTERFNRQSYFDPNAAIPLQVPCLPGEPCLDHLHGGIKFVDARHRTNYGTDLNNFGPRFGFAYQLKPKLVLRGGYGLFYSITRNGVAGTDTAGWTGFSQDTTDWPRTYRNDGATPWGRLADPFPITGPDLPPGSSLGLLTNIGSGFRLPIRSVLATPYEQTWALGVQRELPGDILIDANYVGKKGTKLYFGGAGGLNYLGPWIESATPDQLTALNENVPNPFFGIIQNGSLSGDTVQLSQLLVPYPQFTDPTADEFPFANSIYHAFQLRVEKRFSQGLQFLVTYTASKSIDDSSITSGDLGWLGGQTSLQDPNRRNLERSLSQFDIPQVLQFSYVYELPVGRGKKLGTNLNPWLNGFLGGWETTGIWRFSKGQPLSLSLSEGTSLPTYGAQRPDLIGQLQVNDRSKWFCDGPSCGYFANQGANQTASDVAVNPPPFTLGAAPRTLPNVRNPGINLANLALFKEIPMGRFREGMRLEYRVEAFNAFNHPHFCGPDATIDSGSFGHVTSICTGGREIQMALKFYW